MYKSFVQGQIVEFKEDFGNGEILAGTGEIVGRATSEITGLGSSWIIQPISLTGTVKLPNKTYPFTHIALFDPQLEAVE